MSSKFALGVLGVAIIAVLSLGFAGYSAMNPHTMTVTGQQFVTDTQIGTTTVTSVNTVNSQAMDSQSMGNQAMDSQATQTVASATTPSGAAFQQNCGPSSSSYGCNWPYTYDDCQGTGQGNTVACDGYLVQGPSGCVELAVPTDTVSQPAYDHYALQNLPSSYPSIGSWVVVKGGLTLSTTPLSASSNWASSCPTSAISVTSIQPVPTNASYPNPSPTP